MKLLFIRHAQSIGNQQRRMQGHGDFELSEDGRRQAEKLAQRLMAEFWWPSHVYTSPLKRAVQTTEILLNNFITVPLPAAVRDLIDSSSELSGVGLDGKHPHKLQLHYAEELKEHQNGILTGLTWAEAQAQYPELCQTLETSLDWIPIPGAESLQEARGRTKQFIQALLTQHQDSDQIWIVTHSWILQHLISELLGSDRSWRMHAQNTALFEFWINLTRWNCTDQNLWNTDLWQIRRFNDYRHLLP
ncbi:histidine phosphatase family protein [Leptolyngbya sp. 'hensonii']|uniref:histidine phosphatase family protein n=1 Tax=Leptolyngbya sp. 'hensonii' TaxID=1922337 RepID=UPI0009500B9A|nr:histidine phosphatase family protein [Leptolyngbya sp. 'hensonii']OLP19067.1 histidine phosphatase family protein [Leptolyngbya sp. 'hensonii']